MSGKSSSEGSVALGTLTGTQGRTSADGFPTIVIEGEGPLHGANDSDVISAESKAWPGTAATDGTGKAEGTTDADGVAASPVEGATAG